MFLEFQGYLAEREQRVAERLREREADEDAGERHKVRTMSCSHTPVTA